MIEIRKPDGMDPNEFSNRLKNAGDGFTGAMERRDKGTTTDHYIALWDDTISPAPSMGQIQAASPVNKSRLRRLALDVAAEKVAADVIADIDNGVLDSEDKVRNSDKYRTREAR